MLQVAPIAIALWGTLIPGPNAVGFRSEILSDPIRQYELDRKPRPVQAATWYPAEASSGVSMQFGDYLDITSPNPALAAFAVRLTKFTRNTVVEDLYQKPLSALSDGEKDTLNPLLKTGVYARKGAVPRNGRFPLLLYSHGRDGTYEEDSVLFEYLASHGYVVLSTAFPCQDAAYIGDCPGPSQFRVGDRVGDLYFLLHHASTLPFVDMSRIALAGHSAGGQTSIQWAFQNSLARPVVSLDSTIERWGLGAENFDDLRRMIEGNSRYATPTLLFAPLRHARKNGEIVVGMDIRPKFESWMNR